MLNTLRTATRGLRPDLSPLSLRAVLVSMPKVEHLCLHSLTSELFSKSAKVQTAAFWQAIVNQE